MHATRLGTLWFGFDQRVDRHAYPLSGFALMAFKYATDALIIWAATGALWTPPDYLSPLLSTRLAIVGRNHADVLVIWFVWTLPFAWIGASMTVRRALDAGLSAWSALVFFVPVVNYLWMLLLFLLPTASRARFQRWSPRSARHCARYSLQLRPLLRWAWRRCS
jgi:uncharacterized membrane protein YhaH (DUF805 family)